VIGAYYAARLDFSMGEMRAPGPDAA
jgi:hypothetical protein